MRNFIFAAILAVAVLTGGTAIVHFNAFHSRVVDGAKKTEAAPSEEQTAASEGGCEKKAVAPPEKGPVTTARPLKEQCKTSPQPQLAFCKIIWVQPNGNSSNWSGVLLIGPDGKPYAATTPHGLLLPGMQVKIETRVGTFTGTVVRVHKTADAGLIRLDVPSSVTLPVATVASRGTKLSIGDPLLVMSLNHPRTKKTVFSRMKIVEENKMTNTGSRTVRLSKPVWSGASGSACLTVANEVFGLVWGSARNSCQMTDYTYLQDLLETL